MVSVIVCTRNRSFILNECLNSLIHQSCESNLYEIIVVDNGSVDDTKKNVYELMKKNQNLKYYYEEKIGLSKARNSGAFISKFDYLVYVDDDGKVKNNFIGLVIEIIKEYKYLCFGGWFIPWYKTPPPKWLPDKFGSSICYLNSIGILSDDLYIPGGIFVINRKILQQIGGFPEWLGMEGNKIGYGEENYVQHLIRKSGIKIGFSPDLILEHLVADYKYTLSWHFKKLFAKGRDMQLQIGKMKIYHRLFILFKIIIFLFIRPIWYLPELFKKNYFIQNYLLNSLGYCYYLLGKISV